MRTARPLLWSKALTAHPLSSGRASYLLEYRRSHLWKWRWIVAWFLSVCLAIVAGLWLLFVLNPPGNFHEYRGVTQALFLRLCHEDKITFYGPIEVSARWGNQPHWHQMTVQDLTMTIDQFHKGIDAIKPVGSACHNLETDDAIQGPKFHLTLQ
jgi:hypothetical protein